MVSTLLLLLCDHNNSILKLGKSCRVRTPRVVLEEEQPYMT